jgi:hypothetical protein
MFLLWIDIGVLFAAEAEMFLFDTVSRPALGPTQPPIQWVPGVLSLGVKRPAVKLTTHLHIVSRSKNEWSYTSTPQYVFMAWYLVKHRDNITFTCVQVPSGPGLHVPLLPYLIFVGVKQPAREADYSPSSSVEVKKAWSFTFTPPICLRGFVCN